jgi:hypothetical protein
MMATSKTGRRSGAAKAKTAPSSTEDEKPVALTVKVNSETYVRLCTLGATKRRTNQDILREALEEYLDRVGA